MRVLLTTASAFALLAAPALAATTPAPPGAGTSGATTSQSTASQSTTNPSAAPSTAATGAQTGTNQTGTNQTGTNQTGTNQTGASQSASNAPSTNNSASASQADQTFVKKAASGNMAEVQMGKLAEQKSHNPAVQEFGRWMQTDHTMAEGLLKQSVQSLNIQLPTKPNAADMKAMKKLQTVSGTKFDHQYIDGAVTDHQQDIKLFQNEAQNGQDAKLKSYAKAMLPALKAHLQEAQALQSNMSSRTASGASGTSAAGNTAVGAGNAGTARLNQQELNKIQHR